jgi:hypothetical protein
MSVTPVEPRSTSLTTYDLHDQDICDLSRSLPETPLLVRFGSGRALACVRVTARTLGSFIVASLTCMACLESGLTSLITVPSMLVDGRQFYYLDLRRVTIALLPAPALDTQEETP